MIHVARIAENNVRINAGQDAADRPIVEGHVQEAGGGKVASGIAVLTVLIRDLQPDQEVPNALIGVCGILFGTGTSVSEVPFPRRGVVDAKIGEMDRERHQAGPGGPGKTGQRLRRCVLVPDQKPRSFRDRQQGERVGIEGDAATVGAHGAALAGSTGPFVRARLADANALAVPATKS